MSGDDSKSWNTEAWQAFKAKASKLPMGWDLTDKSVDSTLEEHADAILAMFASTKDMKAAEQSMRKEQSKLPIILLLAMKMALSKRVLQECDTKTHVSWVVAMFKEQNRILPKEKHENGEDFIRRKVRQMRWLAKGLGKDKDKTDDKMTWSLVFCDDGCPNQSGKLAQKIIDEEKYDNCTVLFLEEACKKQPPLPILHGLKTADDSRKGGAVHYGMWWAVENEKPKDAKRKHIVGYTDSDLSSHLSQTGLLVVPIVSGAVLTLATRYEDGGVECTHLKPEALEESVSDPGGIAFRHFVRKNIMPPLKNTFDTQCGFKCMDAEKLGKILPAVDDKQASFDMEFLVVTGLLYPGDKTLVKVPVVWIYSAAESNFWQSSSSVYDTHYKMTKSMLALSEKQTKLFSKEQLAHREPYMKFFGGLTREQFERMCTGVKEKAGADWDRFNMDWKIEVLAALAGDASDKSLPGEKK